MERKKEDKISNIMSRRNIQKVEPIEPKEIISRDFSNVVTNKDIIVDSFKFFDNNENGHISCREYFNILLETKQFTEQEIAMIIKESGLDINDKLDYNNFYEFWKYQ